MSLYKTIQEDRKQALGNDRVKYNLYGVIIAELQRKTTSTEIEDSVVHKCLKKLHESVSESLKYSDDDKLKEEIILLEALLPEPVIMLTPDELLSIMKDAVSSNPELKDKKNMFSYLKSNFDGKYNGKDVNILFSQLD